MTDMTNQVDVQNYLSISERMVLSFSIPYQGHNVKMVLLRDKITLKDLVKSMIAHTILPKSLYSEALKMIVTSLIEYLAKQ